MRVSVVYSMAVLVSVSPGTLKYVSSATCHELGGGASCMGLAAMSYDMVGWGRLFCVGGSIVADGLELLG
jgi:hypothetical protein